MDKIYVEREKIGADEPDAAEISKSGIPICIDCGIVITPDNYSGWEGFSYDLPEGMSGPLCIECDNNRNNSAKNGVVERS